MAIIGTRAADYLVAPEGGGFVRGKAGNDTLRGSVNNDSLFGDDGRDSIRGEDGNDWIRGMDGNDEIWGGYGDDEISGGKGNDNISGGEGADWIRGDKGNDTLADLGGYGNRIEGGPGRDALFAYNNFGNFTTLVGGRDADKFYVGFDAEGERGLVVIEDFRPDKGDRLELSYAPGPGVLLDNAQTFALFDSDSSGVLDDADEAVAFDGVALHLVGANGTLSLVGVDQLDWLT